MVSLWHSRSVIWQDASFDMVPLLLVLSVCPTLVAVVIYAQTEVTIGEEYSKILFLV